MKAYNAEAQATVSPQKALQFLKEGNERFVNKNMLSRDLLNQVHDTANGQWPFAVILSCIDSRTSSELVFDQGIGDVFNARVAGNIINADILGSIEYACKVAGSKLIAVVSHSKCGAVVSACKDVKVGNITELLSKVRPAVIEVEERMPNADYTNNDFVESVAHQNALNSLHQILERSEMLRDMFDNGEIGLVVGHHDVSTGKVNFMHEMFKERMMA